MSGHSPAGRAYLDLQAAARAQARPTDALLVTYALEGFLARLAAGPERDLLVLKGGVLLAVFGARRPTRDIDLQAHTFTADQDRVLTLVRGIAGRGPFDGVDDGLVFDTAAAKADAIREDALYAGVRVTMPVSLDRARLKLSIDVNVGDLITPPPRDIHLPRVLDGRSGIPLRGYPVEMVLAEKIITALQRGTANTRWRDFSDVHTLTATHTVSATALTQALHAVAGHRGTDLVATRDALDGYGSAAAAQWRRHRTSNGVPDLPEDFTAVLQALADFAAPALTGVVDEHSMWHPEDRAWS